MSKKSSIIFISAIVILLTFSFFMYDIITAYNIEKISDDISKGMLGVAFRISFVFPIIIAEISVLFDIVFLLSKHCKMDFMFVLHIIAFSISAMVIVFSTMCYMGSTNKIFQILLLSGTILLLSVKAICGLLNITHREAANKK